MKLREALDTYMFDNVGQFGGIAESLGYNLTLPAGPYHGIQHVPGLYLEDFTIQLSDQFEVVQQITLACQVDAVDRKSVV